MSVAQPSKLLSMSVLVSLLAACRQSPAHQPNANNEPPVGFVDSPKNDETVGREVEVSGWALDDRGVAAVRIYVDGQFKARTGLTLLRPDVSKVYPKYATRGDTHGWRVLVDLGEAATPHTIRAQVVDDEGATRDLGPAVVTVIGR